MLGHICFLKETLLSHENKYMYFFCGKQVGQFIPQAIDINTDAMLKSKFISLCKMGILHMISKVFYTFGVITSEKN